MNIAVVAANGRTGRAFVAAALAAGHTVRAGSFRSGTLPFHPNLTEITCDATNQAHVEALLDGQDAVASFIGHVKGSAATVQTSAIQMLVEVMCRKNIKRIVSLTGTGVRFPGDHITLADRFLNFGIEHIDPARVSDGRRHVEILQASGLDWTVLRVLKLLNVAAAPFSLKEHGPTKLFVGREEVALAALQVLEDNLYIQKAPIISREDSRAPI